MTSEIAQHPRSLKAWDLFQLVKQIFIDIAMYVRAYVCGCS